MRLTRSQAVEDYQKHMMFKHKKFYKWLAVLGVIALFAALNMQMQNIWIQCVYKPQQNIKLNIDSIRQNQIKAPKIMSENANKKTDNKTISESMNFTDIVNADKYQKEIQKYIIGAIWLPNAGNVSLPIILANSNPKVQKAALAVGVATPMSNMNFDSKNLALGGHNMDQPNVLLSNLTDLQNGDKVYLTDTLNVYTYKVYSKFEVMPSAVNIFKQKKYHHKNIITLYTCNYNGSRREIVRAYRSKKTDYNKASQHIKKHFNFSSKKKETIV